MVALSSDSYGGVKWHCAKNEVHYFCPTIAEKVLREGITFSTKFKYFRDSVYTKSDYNAISFFKCIKSIP